MTKRKTSVIGFPRIGKKRELKFASESFFKGDITEGELRQVAADLRRYGWKKQNDAGITFIPSNDFSFYDNMLDTAFIFGVVPTRYRNLGLGRIETYFAASHGYQGEKAEREGRCLVIRPETSIPIGHVSHNAVRMQQVYEMGRHTGIQHIQEIKKYICE